MTASATGLNPGAIGPDGQHEKRACADQGGPETDMTSGPYFGGVQTCWHSSAKQEETLQ